MVDKDKLTNLIKTTLHVERLNRECTVMIDDYIEGKEDATSLAWFIIDEHGLNRRYNRRPLLDAITKFEQENKQLNNK